MSDYIVSARKYRPTTFDSVVGQNQLTTTLRNSIASKRLAHAYLFCGPRGVGKTTCARIFAKSINCSNQQANGDACNECESCKAFNEQRSMNIYELDAASNNGVDEMRSLIEQTAIPPQIGSYKVFIIDEVHMLSQAAFNAFLKTLEEPPKYVIFVLATTEKHKLLPTIISRCQIYDFHRMEVQDMIGHLKLVAEKEGIRCEDAALNVIAQKADGGMRDALSIFDQVASFCNNDITYEKTIEDLNVLDYEYYFRLVDCCLGGDVRNIMLLVNDVLGKGFEARDFVGGLSDHLRRLLVAKDVMTIGLLETSDDVKQRYVDQAVRCRASFLYKAIRRCTDCDLNYRQSQNKRLLVELTMIEIAQDVDDEGSGLCPTKMLKPIFTKLRQAKHEQASSANSQTRRHADTQTRDDSLHPNGEQSKIADLRVCASARLRNAPLRSFSIKNALQNKSQEAKDKSQNEVKSERRTNAIAKPFCEQELQLAWKLFGEGVDNLVIGKRIQWQKPMIVDEIRGEIRLELMNQMLIDMMKPYVEPLVEYLCGVFGRDDLHISIALCEIEKQDKILTQAELLDKLCKQSPAVKYLVERLDLELG